MMRHTNTIVLFTKYLQCFLSFSRSGFFFFCNEERGKVKALYPSYGVGDIAKELGKRWEVCQNKPKFEALAAKDKQRYEQVFTNVDKNTCYHLF